MEQGARDWRLDGYTEVSELGAGGFGRVVLAKHQASGELVAIKYLHPRHLSDPDVLATFRQEAVLLHAVSSPHVARALDFVHTPDGAALVMTAVRGVSLTSVLTTEGLLAPESALAVLKGSLLGLAAAHSAGVLHRDFKPDNVLVSERGESCLVDFGLAILDGQQGLAAGTPAYLAPEAWSGRQLSPATDVYAATCVFFRCVTGTRPYEGQTSEDFRALHEQAPVPVDQAPPPVQGLIARGMAKDPAERPSSAREFLAELEAAAVAGYGEDWERRGWKWLAAPAGGLLALSPLALLGAGTTAGVPIAGAAGVGASAGAVGTASGGIGAAALAKAAGALVGVGALVAGAVVIYGEVTAETSEPQAELAAQVRVLSGTTEDPELERDLEYVEITGHPDPDVQSAVNAALRAPIDERVDHIHTRVENDRGPTPRIVTRAQILLQNDDLISVRYDHGLDGVSWHREWYVPETVTVDLDSGDVLGSADIFREEVLTAEGMTTLTNRLVDYSDPERWSCLRASNLPAPIDGSGGAGWNRERVPLAQIAFSERHVSFDVRFWELGCAFASGRDKIEIPTAELADLLRPELLTKLGQPATSAGPSPTRPSASPSATPSAQPNTPDGEPITAGRLTLRLPDGWVRRPQGLEWVIVDGNRCPDPDKYYDCPRFLVTDNSEASDGQPHYQPGRPYVRSAAGRRCNAIGRKDLAQEGRTKRLTNVPTEVGGKPAQFEHWEVQCVPPGSGKPSGEPLEQRIWYLAEENLVIVDEFGAQGLDRWLADAEVD